MTIHLDALRTYCRTGFGVGRVVEVTNFVPFTKGRQHRMFSFTATGGNIGKNDFQSMILRLYDGPGGSENAEYEYKILKGLSKQDIPVPKVYVLEKKSSCLGAPFVIMEKVDGETLSTLLLEQARNGDLNNFDGVSPLIDQMAGLMASIHSLDYRRSGLEFLKFRRWPVNSMIEALDHPDVRRMFYMNASTRELLGWLLATRANEGIVSDPVMLHFDFHPGNLIVKNGQALVIIDWVDACPGNAALDVGRTNLFFHKRNSGELARRFTDAYQHATGLEIKSLAFYEVLAGCREFFDLLILRGGDAAQLNKYAGVTKFYDIEQEIKAVASFIFERTGIDTAGI